VEADVPIAVFRVSVDGADGADGTVYAIDDTCTHQKASLSTAGWTAACGVPAARHVL